ncbi:MAG: antitoxin [Candidatus Riflebacteria bacterium HGW-Riflebacteria-1]|nr:MAG: antitoxin [Candidatus Riflebacteria bacterium HGW-Riflebacteria-1]
MKTITIRGIDDKLDQIIKTFAKDSQMSVNQWLLQALKKVTGLDKQRPMPEYHDLDSLAGGWTKEEFEKFESSNQIFEVIDEEIWK